MQTYKIAVIAGDGIGPEVVSSGLERPGGGRGSGGGVPPRVSLRRPRGAATYLQCGEDLPAATLAACRSPACDPIAGRAADCRERSDDPRRSPLARDSQITRWPAGPRPVCGQFDRHLTLKRANSSPISADVDRPGHRPRRHRGPFPRSGSGSIGHDVDRSRPGASTGAMLWPQGVSGAW